MNNDSALKTLSTNTCYSKKQCFSLSVTLCLHNQLSCFQTWDGCLLLKKFSTSVDKGARILPAVPSLSLTGFCSQRQVSNSEKPAARSKHLTEAVIRVAGAVPAANTHNCPSVLSLLRKHNF